MSEEARNPTVPRTTLEFKHPEGLEPFEILIHVVHVTPEILRELSNGPKLLVGKDIEQLETLGAENREGFLSYWNHRNRTPNLLELQLWVRRVVFQVFKVLGSEDIP